MNTFKKITCATLVSAAILTSASASAATLKQSFCSQSTGQIAAKVYGDGSNTSVHVSVRSGYDYVYYDTKPITSISTIYFTKRLGKLDPNFAQMDVWSDDGTLRETINCE